MKKSLREGVKKHLYGIKIIFSSVICILICISVFNSMDKISNGKFSMCVKAAENIGIIKLIRKQINAIEVEECPVKAMMYNTELDREYKAAFKAVLLGGMSIQHEDGHESYFREISPEIRESSDEEYAVIIRKAFYYYYMDFDKDGFPELLIKPQTRDVHFGGIRILKYSSDDKKVYYLGEEYRWTPWSLLGAGQLYYVKHTNADTFEYGYQEINSSGVITKELCYNFTVSPNPSIYWLSDSHWPFHNYLEVEKEVWEETERHFEALDAGAFPSVTFEELFNE